MNRRFKARTIAACDASVEAELQAYIRDHQASLDELIASHSRALAETIAKHRNRA